MRKQKYYCTGNNTAVQEEFPLGYVIEHNSAINMWRINHKKGIPFFLMGYSPHLTTLKKKLNTFIKARHKKKQVCCPAVTVATGASL